MKSKLLKLTVASLMVFTIKTQAQITPPATLGAAIFVDGFENWAGTPLQPTMWQQAGSTMPAANVQQTSSSTSSGATPLIQSGNYSCNLVNTSTTYSYMQTAASFSVTAGMGYAISYYARGKGDISAGMITGTVTTGTGGAEVISGKGWHQFRQTVTAPSTGLAAFYLKVKSTGVYSKSGVTITGIDVDSFVVQPYTIVDSANLYSINYLASGSGNPPFYGQSVKKTGGIVTSVQVGSTGPQGYYLQNSHTNGWAAMSVYDFNNAPLVHVGDSITFGGAVDVFFGQIQMSNITNFVNVSTLTGHQWPQPPMLLTTSSMQQQMYESYLISLQGVTVGTYSANYGQASITDASAVSALCDTRTNFYSPNGNTTSSSSGGYPLTNGATYCFIGNVEYSFGWNIEPRDSADIYVGTCAATWGIQKYNNALHANVYPNPASNQLTIELPHDAAKINVSFFDVLGKEVYLVNNLSGSMVSMNDINLPAGVYMVRITADGVSQTTKIIKQ